jgi:hypothetical protein
VDKNALHNLACLASLKLHDKFIDNATVEEYVSPNDLIMDCLTTLERFILHSDYKNKDRMLNLYVYIHKEVDDYPADLYKSKQWNNVVTSVRNYLIHIEGFPIERWEKKQNL